MNVGLHKEKYERTNDKGKRVAFGQSAWLEGLGVLLSIP